MSDYGLDADDDAQGHTYSAALFFAGYGVMRWHLGYPLGDVTIHPDGGKPNTRVTGGNKA